MEERISKHEYRNLEMIQDGEERKLSFVLVFFNE